MKKILLSSLLLVFCVSVYAFEQEDIVVRSNKMNKGVPVTVVTPDGYDTAQNLPVVYLLHGYSGNNTKWNENGLIGRLSDLYDLIFVCPDGGYDSWYFDSKITPEYQYETFVTSELIDYVDRNYKTISDRKGRAIAGISMGGHGAMYLGIRHQDLYCSMAALSGGVDFRGYPEKWGIAKRLGPKDEYPDEWEQNTVINMIHLLQPGSMNIVIDCGTEDFFYKINCALHKKLLAAKIPHVTENIDNSSEIGLLNRNISNGGRGLSLRDLMDQIYFLIL